MSKPIKITNEILQEYREHMETTLKDGRLSNGKITFTHYFNSDDKQATVLFTPEAWIKMTALIAVFDKEIAWHGVAHRSDETPYTYIISDILVYPQTVTGTSVEMDEAEYALWIAQGGDDERMFNLRMQGHSHVNMHVSPSLVDLGHQEKIVRMLGDDDFYIFMVWNKSYQRSIKIYDMQRNTLFENNEITVKLTDEILDISNFISDSMQIVKTPAAPIAGLSRETANAKYKHDTYPF